MKDAEKVDIVKIIHDVITGTASQSDERRLSEWMDADPEHKAIYERILSDDKFASRYRHYSEIDGESAWNRFKAKYLSGSFPRLKKAGKYVAAAAVLAIGLAAILVHKEDNTQPSREEALTPLPSKVEQAIKKAEQTGRQRAMLTATGSTDLEEEPTEVAVTSAVEYEKMLEAADADDIYQLSTSDMNEYWLTMEDGSLIHLNFATRLKYPVKFAADNRMVYLEGEAYFKVAKDRERPFYVSTPDGMVRVYGTEFCVNTHRRGGGTEVVLMEGEVSVTPLLGYETKLKPGEKAVMAERRSPIVSAVDLAPYRAWNEGEYLFKDSRLCELMDIIGRWYGVSVEFADEGTAQICFTGSIDRYGRLEHILNALWRVTGIEMEREGTTVYVGNKQI